MMLSKVHVLLPVSEILIFSLQGNMSPKSKISGTLSDGVRITDSSG